MHLRIWGKFKLNEFGQKIKKTKLISKKLSTRKESIFLHAHLYKFKYFIFLNVNKKYQIFKSFKFFVANSWIILFIDDIRRFLKKNKALKKSFLNKKFMDTKNLH